VKLHADVTLDRPAPEVFAFTADYRRLKQLLESP